MCFLLCLYIAWTNSLLKFHYYQLVKKVLLNMKNLAEKSGYKCSWFNLHWALGQVSDSSPSANIHCPPSSLPPDIPKYDPRLLNMVIRYGVVHFYVTLTLEHYNLPGVHVQTKEVEVTIGFYPGPSEVTQKFAISIISAIRTLERR